MANIREQIAQDGKAIPLRGGFGKFNNFLPTPSPTVTPSNRPTPTQTPTQTSTQTNTRTPTRTKSRTRPETPTSTPTASVTRTPSPTYTPTATNTPTRTRTQTRTRNVTQSQTPTQTRTQSRTNTQTPTVTRTITPSISPSSTSPFGVAKRSSINVLKNVDWDTVLPPQPTPAPFSPIGNDTYITKQNSYFWDLSTMRVSSNASLNSNFWGASQSDVFNISGISFRPWYPGLEDDGYTSENYSFNTAPGATQFWNLSSGGALSDSIRNALVNVSMITPQHGVCAIHQGLSSMVGTSVYFYRHTDQAPLKRTVSAVYNLNYDSNIQTVDTGVVKLDSALPAGYKVYKVALFDNFLANDFVLTPLPILTMGGMNVPGANTNETKQDIAMGVNNQQIFNPPIPYGIGFREGGFFGPPGDYSGQVYHKQRYNSYGVTLSGYDPSLPDKVFALQFASGDSGNPAFVVYDNELILSTILHTTVQGDAYINPTINQALSDAVDTLGNEGYSINTQNIWKA